MARRPLIAGNWKMHGLTASIGILKKIIAGTRALERPDIMVCPPATLVADFAKAARGTPVVIGGQDCHALASGAHTGDISAEMLRDAGAQAVIVGHSERRSEHCESDAKVRAKALAAHRAGLTAIVCVGEQRADRDGGRARDVVCMQLDGSLPDAATGLTAKIVVAYEPVWAIGSGLTPTPGDVADMHALIHRQLVLRYGEAASGIRILYGGSVRPGNARELLMVENVDGALIGGASLDADEFLAIADVYR
jgi:triosephosphate isomerase (TIM)